MKTLITFMKLVGSDALTIFLRTIFLLAVAGIFIGSTVIVFKLLMWMSSSDTCAIIACFIVIFGWVSISVLGVTGYFKEKWNEAKFDKEGTPCQK